MVTYLKKVLKRIYGKTPNLFIWKMYYAHKRYAIKQLWHTHKNLSFEYKNKLYEGFKPILQTPCLKCNPNATTELHTLIYHYHIFMYITAIKSLLRYYNDISVVVHDGDGDLTGEDKKLLKEHIDGIKIIDKNFADREFGKQLRRFPRCRKYRARCVNSMELFDNILLSKSEKIISMNSDILFLKKPDELVKWICDGKNEMIYVHENTPATQKEFLAECGCDFPPHVTLALVCFYKEIMDLGLIEKTLGSSKLFRTHLWEAGQCIFPVLLKSKSDKYIIRSFDRNKFDASAIFREGAIFRHYWNSTMFFADKHLDDARVVIQEIAKLKG